MARRVPPRAKLHKTKPSSNLILGGVPFMSIVQISTFYLANLATPPRGRAPGARGVPPTTKLHKTKSSWNLILGGVPFIKNVAILTFENCPSRAHGFPPRGPRGGPKQKVA